MQLLADTIAHSEESSDVPIVPNAAASGSCGSNLTWNLSGGTLTISGSGAMYDYAYNETASRHTSRGASSGYGLQMETLAKLRYEGKTIDELYDWALKNRLRIHHLFCSTTLTYYVRGGRISPAAGRIGNLLGICPVMRMDHPGHLAIHSRVRTKKRALRALVDQMAELADGGEQYSGRCFISHSDCEEDALTLKKMVEERFKRIDGEIEVYMIGMTIGCHSGPGTVAVYFFGRER